MLEVIDIANPTEQDIVVPYGDRDITIELRWNDILAYWVIGLKENNEYIASGISCTAVNSNLLYDKFKLGKLYIVDTEPDSIQPIDLRNDLGKRLALTREYA